MGLFKRLAGAFSKIEKVEIMVPFRDLYDWVESNTRNIVDEGNAEVKHHYSELISKTEEIGVWMNRLREAKLKNPDIEPRMLQFMTGNRENYIQQIGLFITNLPKLNEDFYSKYQEQMNSLLKKTGRSYQILQEFFANEAKAIATKLRELDELAKKINELQGSGKLKKIYEIKEKIRAIEQMQQTKESTITKIESSEKVLSKDKEELNQINEQILAKKNSPEHQEYNKLVAERGKTLSKIENA